jgi:hypothetical protein
MAERIKTITPIKETNNESYGNEFPSSEPAWVGCTAFAY